MLAIFVIEVVGLVMYEKRRNETYKVEQIAQDISDTAGFQAFEPSYLPDGFKLKTARSENMRIEQGKTASSVLLDYASYLEDKPTWVKSAISIRQIDVREVRPITNCFIAEGYNSYDLQEIEDIYDCNKVDTRNGTDIYRYNVKDAYRGLSNYSEIKNYYLTKDNVWFDLEPYGAEELEESEVLRIIESFVPLKD